VTPKTVTNLAASVRQRLLNLSHESGENFNLVLAQYALERLLYRLGESDFTDQFVLKGAMLFVTWSGRLPRPTYDLDLLGYGAPSAEALARIFTQISTVDVDPDGLIFHPETIRVSEIRAEQEYGGQRIELMASLEAARIPVRVDVGFGDIVTPAAELVRFPTLLDFPPPCIYACPRETVVAEKLHAMVVLGLLNSRIKDFYDVWLLSRLFDFDGSTLAKAIDATFHRRRTTIPTSRVTALTPAFAADPGKVTQWQAFLRRNRLDVGGRPLTQVVADILDFVEPPLRAAAGSTGFAARWPAGGPWTE
jgi:predicted nucleotidyltransferase component of viral defense system